MLVALEKKWRLSNPGAPGTCGECGDASRELQDSPGEHGKCPSCAAPDVELSPFGTTRDDAALMTYRPVARIRDTNDISAGKTAAQGSKVTQSSLTEKAVPAPCVHMFLDEQVPCCERNETFSGLKRGRSVERRPSRGTHETC